MPALPVIKDPTGRTDQNFSALDRFFIDKLRDPRDLPFVYLALKITLVMIPMGLLMYVPGVPNWLWWSLAVGYFITNNFIFKGPFGLMLHCTSHRKWFKHEYGFFNHYLPWFVGPFFGQTPETYYSHHIGMHHPENNMPEDESSTMDYQRDNFLSFLSYFADFFFLGIYKLTSYFKKRHRPKLIRKALRGEFLFFAFCAALCLVDWSATLMVFILPFAISRFIMMAGNWTQHAFVDHSDPNNPYKNSINCINVKYNRRCWNDGYHISHHIAPTMHWTEHPSHLKNNVEAYRDNQALIFDGVDFLGIFALLMRGKYETLADKVVDLGGWESREELIAIMKHRTRRFSKEELATYA